MEGKEIVSAVREFLQKMVLESRLSEEYLDCVRLDRIERFLKSELGYRAWLAQRAGKLFREQPFVLAIPATALNPAYPEEEKVLIQGIIDAYFEESAKEE